MLSSEWDWTMALEVCREESFEEGRVTGREEGIAIGQSHILELLSKGYTLEEIKRELALG